MRRSAEKRNTVSLLKEQLEEFPRLSSSSSLSQSPLSSQFWPSFSKSDRSAPPTLTTPIHKCPIHQDNSHTNKTAAADWVPSKKNQNSNPSTQVILERRVEDCNRALMNQWFMLHQSSQTLTTQRSVKLIIKVHPWQTRTK